MRQHARTCVRICLSSTRKHDPAAPSPITPHLTKHHVHLPFLLLLIRQLRLPTATQTRGPRPTPNRRTTAAGPGTAAPHHPSPNEAAFRRPGATAAAAPARARKIEQAAAAAAAHAQGGALERVVDGASCVGDVPVVIGHQVAHRAVQRLLRGVEKQKVRFGWAG